MNTLNKISVLLLVTISLSACGGETATNSVYYEPETEYRLFPIGYFSPGYHQDYALSGYDTQGKTYSGNAHIVTDAGIYFDREYSIPVTSTIKLFDNYGGAETFSAIHFYYSQQHQRYLNGTENILSGEIAFAEYLYQIPVHAYIGDSGRIGEYVTSTGNTIIRNWQLKNATPGFSRFVLTTSSYNTFNQLESLFERSVEINQNGDIYSINIVSYDASSGIYTYLEGIPQ